MYKLFTNGFCYLECLAHSFVSSMHVTIFKFRTQLFTVFLHFFRYTAKQENEGFIVVKQAKL